MHGMPGRRETGSAMLLRRLILGIILRNRVHRTSGHHRLRPMVNPLALMTRLLLRRVQLTLYQGVILKWTLGYIPVLLESQMLSICWTLIQQVPALRFPLKDGSATTQLDNDCATTQGFAIYRLRCRSTKMMLSIPSM